MNEQPPPPPPYQSNAPARRSQTLSDDGRRRRRPCQSPCFSCYTPSRCPPGPPPTPRTASWAGLFMLSLGSLWSDSYALVSDLRTSCFSQAIGDLGSSDSYVLRFLRFNAAFCWSGYLWVISRSTSYIYCDDLFVLLALFHVWVFQIHISFHLFGLLQLFGVMGTSDSYPILFALLVL